MRNAFFMIVAQHMGEDFDDMYKENNNGYLQSTVHREAGKVITALVENVILVASKTISEAVMALMAAYYIFNVGYPYKMRRTFLFLQLELLDIQGQNDKKDNVHEIFL